MMPRFRTALFGCALLTLAACPKRAVDFGKDGEPRSAEDLLNRVNWAEKQVFALKGDAKLFVDSPQGKGAVPVFAAVSHPAFIHLEQFDFFGRPQGVLVTDGARFGLYLAQEGKYYRGPASPANLSRFLPVVMPPAELAAVMLGRAPRIPRGSVEMSFDPTLEAYVLVITQGDVRQTLHVKPPSYRVIKSTAENVVAYSLSFGALVTEGTATVAKELTLDAQSAKTKVEWGWKEVTVNEAPDLTLFEMEPPEGIPVVEVDENGVSIETESK